MDSRSAVLGSQDMEFRSAVLGSRFESPRILGKIEHENGLKM